MTKNEIIERISMLRTRANFSARKLSALIDKNDSYIAGLETRKDFLPPIEVLLQIIEVCGSSPVEFFYYDIGEYKEDRELMDAFRNATATTKKIALEVLKLK